MQIIPGTMGQSSGGSGAEEAADEEDEGEEAIAGFNLSEPCSSKTAEPSPTKKRKSFISHF